MPICWDNVKNGNETDIDCGGYCSNETKCADDKNCQVPTDCISGVCTLGVCQSEYISSMFPGIDKILILEPTCSDNVQNGNETDIDCGGYCTPTKKCGNILGCMGPGDCISGVCTLNVCQGELVLE